MGNHLFFVIFAVLDVSCAVNSCINHSFFLHLYLQFYYVPVAVTLFRVRSTWYGVRDSHHLWGAPVAQQPLPSCVKRLLGLCDSGDVAMYISNNITCCESSIENVDDFEILWSIVRPKQLPRPFSCLIIAVVYCSPNFDASTMKKTVIFLLFPRVID